MPPIIEWNISLFDECLTQAVDAAQVGFYFEEGGCWGMAEALFKQLLANGLTPQLMYRPTGFVHAWVRLGDVDLDWRGIFHAAPGAQPLPNLQALRQVADKVGGTRGDDYLSDVALAESTVADAFVRMGERLNTG